MHSHHTPYNTLQTMYFTGQLRVHLRIGLVHTDLVTCGGVQVVLVKDELDHISMAVLSCPVDHGVPIIVRAVKQ